MRRIIDTNELKYLIDGASLLGTGGGGIIEVGYNLIDRLEKNGKTKMELVTTDEMGDDYAVLVAMIGPLTVDLDTFDLTNQYIKAFETIQEVLAKKGKKVNYLVSCETGGSNTAVPFYISAITGIPVVDADAEGRAVPEIYTGTQTIYEIPMEAMVVTAGCKEKTDVIVYYPHDDYDTDAAEKIARSISVAYGDMAVFTTWPVNRNDIETKYIPGILSDCIEIGKIMENSKKNNLNLIEELSKYIKCKELFRGIITDAEINTLDGFDIGVTTITKEDKSYRVYFKNENMMVKDDAGEVIVTVPDLICLVDEETNRPILNIKDELRCGRKVICIGFDAHDNWKKTEKGYDVWRNILEQFGYKGEYNPIIC